MTNEEAKEYGFVPIKGYENYLISPKGEIFSKKRNKLMSLVKGSHGYLQIKLSNERGAKTFRVHRLVAEAFLPNPHKLPMVNHKDESRDNNNVDNLEWCTREYNLSYGTAMQRKVKNTDYYEISKKRTAALEKPVLQLEYDGTMVALWKNAQVASEHGYNRNIIQKCCKGDKRSHKGYLWQYVEFDYEKQIPKKPILFASDRGDYLHAAYKCPNCQNEVETINDDEPYCSQCGQAILWEDTE